MGALFFLVLPFCILGIGVYCNYLSPEAKVEAAEHRLQLIKIEDQTRALRPDEFKTAAAKECGCKHDG